MRYLIVNADDFGLTAGVTRGIIHAHAEGLVTSTSALTNLSGFHSALAAAAACPELGVGVHLTLTCGRPLLPPAEVPSLVDRRGRFVRRPWRHALLAAAPEVAREWEAQVRAFVSTGRVPTHLDSHHHLHLYPPFADIVCGLALKYRVPAVRVFRSDDPVLRRQSWLKRTCYGRFLRAALNRVTTAGLESPDRAELLTGGTDPGLLAERLHAFLGATAQERGIVELVCHPGHVDAELQAVSALLAEREADLTALTGPEARAAVSAAGVKLVSFAIFQELHASSWTRPQ